MRRAFTTLPVMTMLATGLMWVGPVNPVAASDVTTVWQLVNRTCTGNEVEAGRACFDPLGHAADYTSVGESEANSTVRGEKQDYTYQLPDLVAAGQNVGAVLTATVSQITDGAAHARMCVASPFQDNGKGEPCATTDEAANGQSATASHTVVFLPYQAPTGQVATVLVGFEEPGGQLTYSYKATNHSRKVSFDYAGRVEDGTTTLDIDSSGHFRVVGPLRADMPSESEAGSATFHVRRGSGATHTAQLDFRRATFNDPGKADLFYRVTKSNLKCLPVARQLKIRVRDDTYVQFDACGGAVDLIVGGDNARVQLGTA